MDRCGWRAALWTGVGGELLFGQVRAVSCSVDIYGRRAALWADEIEELLCGQVWAESRSLDRCWQ